VFVKIDIVGKRYWWFALSLLFILPGLFSIVTEGLKLGIDFTGGTIWELQMSKPVEPTQVKDVLAPFGYGDALVQTSQNQASASRMMTPSTGAAIRR
jgi:preprotein translocase subunit SecF